MGSFWSEEKNEEEFSPPQQQNDWVIEAQRFRNPGVSILKEILKNIKLDEDLIRENNAILQEFLRTFIYKLKEVDELFDLLFSECRYFGSFYSDLRVSTPDEFDINMVFRLPVKDSQFEIVHQPQAPSYVKYYLKHNSIAFERYPKLAKTFFDDGYLIPQKVRQWLQSVVDKALRTYVPPRSCTQVRARQAGPARTIILLKRDGTIIDIDLVPVVECTLFLPRSSLDGRVESEVGNDLDAFLVPKPYSSFGRQRPINEREASRLWRSHFPEPEDDIIHDLGCVKPVIKLLKLLRDKEDWKCLASYYLKTVVMWMVLEIDNEDYWREDKMDKRFLDALQKLDRAVEQKRITYLFNKKYNLLEKLNDAQAFNIHCRLAYFIRKINENPRFLWSIFQETPLF